MEDAPTTSPPRENLVRALKPALELRDAEDAGGMPTLYGHFAVFDRWTEIDSYFEGPAFMERIAPGAFKKTMRENRGQIKVTFQHGGDPQLGDKPLGPLGDLREDVTGGYYEVPLLDTAYNRELIPGLEAGLYGASFRFEVLREQIDQAPDASEANPKGLPERTLKEIRLYELGPVTWPAYAEADAQLRSLTDRLTFDAIERDPERFRALAGVNRAAPAATEHDAPAPASAVFSATTPLTATTGSSSSATLVVAHGQAEEDTRTDARRTVSAEPITREEFIGWNSRT